MVATILENDAPVIWSLPAGQQLQARKERDPFLEATENTQPVSLDTPFNNHSTAS
jgi:hypothetical protein